MSRLESTADLEALRRRLAHERDPNRRYIAVCCGTGCTASGSRDVLAAFKEEIERRGLSGRMEAEGRVDLRRTGCHGFCEQGPLVVVRPEGIFYRRVKVEDVPEIVDALESGGVVERLLYVDPTTGEKVVKEEDVPFYRHQQRLLLANNGRIDPTDIMDYIAVGGYRALSKVLDEMGPEDVIREIKDSGLRGRGGAGFPTGIKWELCRRSEGDFKYVLCNADEGDPGAFMDRSLLEGNPHSVLEGMIIGAYAVGAREGVVYVRNEYPLAVEHMSIAIEQARGLGLLGENILGSEMSFDVRINRGGGAFVCGEETALIASVEGRAGEPRPRPPYPAERGLWGRPTLINNVKTWASVPIIINNGADWFSKIGTKTSKGTMIFSLVGKVKNTGLVEVPMGITLRQLVYDIGGGAPDGEVKAVQTGGPSGGCIPRELMDIPVDYERLAEVGSIMGSGGMIVMDERTCMVDVAKYFVSILEDESCGKCTSCREGLRQMRKILTDITEGRGKEGDIELLEELAEVVADASLCALGGTAPNPVLSTIKYFREEYEAHIREKRCPAGVCRALIRYTILEDVCTGCGLCRRNCPQGAISGEPKKPHKIDQDKCIKCGICLDVCRFGAVKVE